MLRVVAEEGFHLVGGREGDESFAGGVTNEMPRREVALAGREWNRRLLDGSAPSRPQGSSLLRSRRTTRLRCGVNDAAGRLFCDWCARRERERRHCPGS